MDDRSSIVSLFFSSDEDETENILAIVAQAAEMVMDTDMSHVRRRHKRARIVNYIEETVNGYSDSLFKEHFRMSRGTMEVLLGVIGRALPTSSLIRKELKRNTMYCIWLLAKQESFLAVGDRFGLAKSSGYKIFVAIIDVLAKQLSRYVKWPDRNKQNHTALVFRRRSGGFPGAIGAIDGCHIQIKAPLGNPIDFYNRHKTHSIILQGTCDHKERFIDIFVGMPGRMHDARVFKESDLGKKLMNEGNPLLPPNLHLLGDSAYPIMPNLMTPFRDNGLLTNIQTTYNVKLSSVRSIIERAFGHLKGKFRRLKYLDISHPQFGNQIIVACCVLHNFLIEQKDLNFEEEDEDGDEDEGNNTLIEDNTSMDLSNAGESRNPGANKRNEIANHFFSNSE